MFQYVDSLKVAHQILTALQEKETLRDMVIYVKVFENYREQGYRLEIETKNLLEDHTIAFAQHKSSDDIVVYHFDSIYTTRIPETFWKDLKYFNADELEEAVEYIEKLIIQIYKK